MISCCSTSGIRVTQSDGLQLWVQMGCPAHKLVLGVPFYGHTYVLSPNNTSYEPGTPIDRDAKVAGGMPYNQVRTTSKFLLHFISK
jgi:GH18 family chitinase